MKNIITTCLLACLLYACSKPSASSTSSASIKTTIDSVENIKITINVFAGKVGSKDTVVYSTAGTITWDSIQQRQLIKGGTLAYITSFPASFNYSFTKSNSPFYEWPGIYVISYNMAINGSDSISCSFSKNGKIINTVKGIWPFGIDAIFQ